jgi:hypothetical protein
MECCWWAWFQEKPSASFTSGAIEYFHPDLAPKHNGLKCIPSQEFELKVINVVDVLIQAAKHTGVSFPVQASFDLFNARGVAMGVNNAWTMSGPRTIDRDSLGLESLVVDSDTHDLATILRPWFEKIWNACGLECSLNYDGAGQFRLSDRLRRYGRSL